MNGVSLILTLTFLVFGQQASDQKQPARRSPITLSDQTQKARAEVIKAASEYKASLEKLLIFQQTDVDEAAKTLESVKRIKEMKGQEDLLNQSERMLAAARAKVTETRKQMAESDALIEEAKSTKPVSSAVKQTPPRSDKRPTKKKPARLKREGMII